MTALILIFPVSILDAIISIPSCTGMRNIATLMRKPNMGPRFSFKPKKLVNIGFANRNIPAIIGIPGRRCRSIDVKNECCFIY
jgi:hypothetical protein